MILENKRNKNYTKQYYMEIKEMEMKFKLKWSIDGETRYNLGLARGMGLARQGVIYTHIYTHFYFPPKSKQARSLSPHLSLSTRLHQEEEGRRKFFFNFSSS